MYFLFLRSRRPPILPRPDTLFPPSTLCRSPGAAAVLRRFTLAGRIARLTASSGPGVIAPPYLLKEGEHMEKTEIAERLEHFLRESFAIAEDDPGDRKSTRLNSSH